MSQVVRTRQIPVARTVAGCNDRTVFEPKALEDLAGSIREHGLISPITVRPSGDGFEIIAGERRFRAISLLGWETFPAIVKEVDDETASALMLAENTARENIDPIDEATAYQSRMARFGWSAEQIAEKAGVSGSRVRQRVKLLALEATIQQVTRSGQLPLSYAQCLVDAALEEPGQLAALRIFSRQDRPTLDWFKGVVAELLKCKQVSMLEEFELELEVQQAPSGETPDPKKLPRPLKNSAPPVGDSAREILENQIEFWKRAAADHTSIGGKWFAYECDMAAKALSDALNAMSK